MEPISRVISKAVPALVIELVDIADLLLTNNSELYLFSAYFFFPVMSVPSTWNFFPLYREKSGTSGEWGVGSREKKADSSVLWYF
jgi:hypothetical protein